MSLEELLDLIKKSKFQNLLIHHKYDLVYKKHIFKGGIQDDYLIGFESSNCKLGFYYGAQIGVAMVAKSSNWASTEWTDLESTIPYLLKLPINYFENELACLEEGIPNRERSIYHLSNIAGKFEQLLPQLISMFQNEEEISRWKPSLEKYIRNNLQHKYGG